MCGMALARVQPLGLARNRRRAGLHGIREGIHESRTGFEDCVGGGRLLFLALIYPLAIFMRQEPALSMMLSLYVTLGVLLLLAIRNTLASRSLIAFTAWSAM